MLFSLSAEKVTAHFEKDLYDITEVYSEGNVLLESSNGTTVKGQKVDYDVKNEKIYIQGKQSFLTNNDFTMKSNENIKINNFLGLFELNGLNSELITSQVEIIGEKILGNFSEINGENIIKKLNAKDNNQVYIKTSNMEMYALEAKYDYNTNIIELFEKVKIIRNEELIIGDYAKINTLDESYKIISKDSNRVKVLLNKVDE